MVIRIIISLLINVLSKRNDTDMLQFKLFNEKLSFYLHQYIILVSSPMPKLCQKQNIKHKTTRLHNGREKIIIEITHKK